MAFPTIKVAILLIVACAIIFMVYSTALPALTNFGVSNESITFTNNETYYDLGNSPIYLSEPYTPVLRYANGTTDVGDYTFTTTQVQIGFDIASDDYYAYYTYYTEPWMGGSNYGWALVIFLITLVVLVLLKLIGIF